MGRSPCCSKEGVNRGAWTAVEDKILRDYIKVHGEGKWRNLPKKAGLNRCGKSCRLRWLNYLRPGIKRGNITHDEEELIIRLHKLLGNRWSLIAGRLPGRTDNEIKNYWNTIIGKKLQNPHQQSSDKDEALNPQNFKPIPSSKPSSDPGVVWTRASRCNKVVIPPELHDVISGDQQKFDGSKNPSVPSPPTATSPEPLPQLQFAADGNDHTSDLGMDFDVDEQFLSDLLNADFSQLTNFDNGVISEASTSEHQGHLSPNSSRKLLTFSDDTLQDNSSFLIMDSFVESGFDWLV